MISISTLFALFSRVYSLHEMETGIIKSFAEVIRFYLNAIEMKYNNKTVKSKWKCQDSPTKWIDSLRCKTNKNIVDPSNGYASDYQGTNKLRHTNTTSVNENYYEFNMWCYRNAAGAIDGVLIAHFAVSINIWNYTVYAANMYACLCMACNWSSEWRHWLSCCVWSDPK